MSEVRVYVATCSVTAKQYVGITRQAVSVRRTRHRQEAFKRGSKTPFHRAIRKYGRDAIIFEHVASARNWDDACEVEKHLIAEMKTIAPGGYNLSPGGQGEPSKFATPESRAKSLAGVREYWKTHRMPLSAIEASRLARRGKRRSPEHRANAAAATKAVMANPEVRARVSAGLKASYEKNPARRARMAEIIRSDPERLRKFVQSNAGRTQDPEVVAKRNASNRGKKRTPEQCAKIAAGRKGWKMSPEQRAHLSAIQRGRTLSEGTKAKISAAGKGRVLSEETRRKISEARKGIQFSDAQRAKIGAASRRMWAAKKGECHVGA